MKTYTENEAKEEIAKLTPGKVLLTSVRKVSGGKFHIELAEKIQSESRSTVNVLGILNAGDDRFNVGGARRAWAPAEKAQLVNFFGFTDAELDGLQEGDDENDRVWVCISNPKLNGIPLKIQIVETTEGDEFQMAHIETKAKRAGKDGPIMTNEGLPIFSNTYVVGLPEGKVITHKYLESDQQMENKAKATLGVETASASAPAEPTLD